MRKILIFAVLIAVCSICGCSKEPPAETKETALTPSETEFTELTPSETESTVLTPSETEFNETEPPTVYLPITDGAEIKITADELEKYRDLTAPDIRFTLTVTDVSDTVLYIATDAEGYTRLEKIAAKGQTLIPKVPQQLQGNFRLSLFEASGIVVFQRLCYHSGDNLALYEGGTFERYDSYYLGSGNNETYDRYFGLSLYRADNGSLRYISIANKYDGVLEQLGDWGVIQYVTDRADVYSDSGAVSRRGGSLALEGGTEVTIGEKFDLDALFGRVSADIGGKYAGCKSIDDIIALNKKEYGLVMTEFNDENWEKMNFDGRIQDQCREFFYNFVSGKSKIPEYNALGVADWKITRQDSLFNMFPAFIFEFTVTGNSLGALPPGHYVKYINDIRWTVMYDTPEGKTKQPDNTDIEQVRMVRGYIHSSYIWDCRDFGGWDGDIPMNYIIGGYGNGSSMPYDDFCKYAEKIFGIEKVNEASVSGFISVRDGVKTISAGDLDGDYYINFPEVDKTGENTEVTVQLYADINGILPSHRLKYTIGKNGEFLKFEILEKSPYEPEGLRRYYTLDDDKKPVSENNENC